MENRVTGKRALDDDDRSESSDRKKFKVDVDLLPPLDNMKKIRDPRKWNRLPSIVYELLALFKKSEKSESCDGDHVNEEQEKVSHTKIESTLLPDENCNEKLFTDFANTKESDTELDKFKMFKSNVENSIQNLKFDFFNDAENVSEVPNNVSSNIEKALSNIEKNDIKQTEQKENEVTKKTNVSHSILNIMPTPSGNIQSASTVTTCNMPVSTLECVKTTKTPPIMTSSTPNNVSCTSTSMKIISDRPVSMKSVSNESECVPTDVFDIPVVTTFGIPSTTNDTISSIPVPLESITINDFQNDVLTENNLLMPLKSKEVHDLLKNLCFQGILEVPATTPPPCICKYCIYVDGLPIENSAINNQFAKFINNPNLHCDMYSTDITTSDCTDVWINDLSSLIRKNEEMYKAPVHDNNTKSSMTAIKNVMTKVAKQIKPHFPFCNFCKKSKRYDSSICIDCAPRYKKSDRHKSNSNTKYRSNRY